jgi:hypothetical protein
MGLFSFLSPDKPNIDVDANGNPTHTRNGVAMSGGTAGGNPAAGRGKPRQGAAPNQGNYALGGDPNYLAGFNQQNAGLATQGQGLAKQGQSLTQQGQGLAQQAAQLGSQYRTLGQKQGDQFGSLATDAQGRAAPTTTYDSSLYNAQSQNVAAGNGQMGLAQQLAAMGSAPEGPSAAQAQLREGTNDALNSQLAMARSGRGLGESATAMSQAGQQASGVIANAANQSAALRAQETQAYRQQQLNALNSSGQQLEAARTGNLGLAQQAAQLGQFNSSTALQQQQLNDAYAQSLYGNQLQSQQLGLQGQQIANQGAQVGFGGAEAGLNAQNQGLAQQLGSLGTGLQAAQAQQQGNEQYENELTNVYGIDTGAHTDARKLDQQNSSNWVQGTLGAVSALATMASDRRMKHRIRVSELDELYRALGGESEAA